MASVRWTLVLLLSASGSAAPQEEEQHQAPDGRPDTGINEATSRGSLSELVGKYTGLAPVLRFGPPQLMEGGNSSNEGACHPQYMVGIDLKDGTRIVAGQLGLPWTGWHGSVYVRSAAAGAGWSRQDHLAGLFGQAFPSVCPSPCLSVNTFGTLVHFSPDEIATGFNFTGDNNTGQLKVSAHPLARPPTVGLPVGVLFSPTGVQTVFRGIPKPVTGAGPFTSGGVRLARGGVASVRLDDGSLLQTAIVTFANQEHLRSPNATSILAFRSVDGVTWDYLATIADASNYPESEEGPNEHDMAFLRDKSSLLVVMRFDGGDGPLTHSHKPFYRTVSHNGGRSWTPATPIHNAGSARPRLLCMGDVMLLSGGRMFGFNGLSNGWDARVWASTDPTGEVWEDYSISNYHNLGVHEFLNSSFAYLPKVNTTEWLWGTTAYTSLVRLDDRRALVAYDMEVPVHASFSMEITVA